MIEIGAQVDLPHPADRVWHALTDRGLLARWFTEAEVEARGRLLLHTAGLPGFDAAVDAEVTDRRPPELIALHCQEAGRRSRLTCAITPTTEGCRLSVREVLEHGTWPAEQRVHREQCYQQALDGRLRAILDWLAFQQVDLRRGEVGMTAELPVTEAFDDVPTDRRRRVLIAVLAAAALTIGVSAWTVLPDEQEHGAGPNPLPVLATAPSATSRSPEATAASRPKRTATPSDLRPSRTPTGKASRTPASIPPSAPPVTARYETVSTRVFGYTGEVVVDNAGGAAARDWTVVVTLSEGGTIASASGADWRQDGQAVTFTGPPVPAGKAQTFRFDVRDALTRAPQGCTINDNPCAGL
ncbi:Uncharacterized conserved protein YndB, AHSA1/START domain [Micromonospora rhizosphaerae]|uniref:Uncharacterized conserved protein YndB, AHSA1/START domain n=1 Tax=Micromonospora rhizosphaerae TaxID=568872 RepID=A0A1C6S260_9ACTN|nr:SRPBCC domain-containing protein [Micromonospora rhizosphaerae]SCL23412.1 Uncharacterized conserved protein YndB, AHSA1/START domain [Micromonospora rhizosphaerae]